MKVETIDPKPSFKPIQITLETQTDVDNLYVALYWFVNGYTSQFPQSSAAACALVEKLTDFGAVK